jgi:hypothetical protein
MLPAVDLASLMREIKDEEVINPYQRKSSHRPKNDFVFFTFGDSVS